MTRDRIGVVVLDLDQAPVTRRCLESLAAGSEIPDVVVVVENGSASVDGVTADLRRRLNLLTLPLRRNLGCAGGRNVGLRFLLANTDAERFVILDNDTVATPDFVAGVRRAPLPELGACSPVVYELNGSRIWSAGGSIERDGSVHQLDMPPPDGRMATVDWLPGACMVMTRASWASGHEFDEDLGFYFEDIDWCCRMRADGGRMLVDPSLAILHEANQSLGGEWSPERVRLWARNRLIFVSRHSGRWSSRFTTTVLAEVRVSWRDLLNGKGRWVRTRGRGIAEGIRYSAAKPIY